MELKANELRIGNLIYTPSGVEKYVFGTRYKTILYTAHLENPTYGEAYDYECEPIPLTEEWLFKFGFKKDIIVDLYRLHNQFGSIIYYPSTSVEKAKINFMLTGACFMNNTITNVHQLQNLYFALTNEELTIKM